MRCIRVIIVRGVRRVKYSIRGVPGGKHAVDVNSDRILARFDIDSVPFARHRQGVRGPGQFVDGAGHSFAGLLAVDLDLVSRIGWSAGVIGALRAAAARLRGPANRDSAVPGRIDPVLEMQVVFLGVPHGVEQRLPLAPADGRLPVIGPVPCHSFWRSWPNEATTTPSNRRWPSPSTFQPSNLLRSRSYQAAAEAAAPNAKSERASNIHLTLLCSLHPSRYPHIQSSARYGVNDRISRNPRTVLPLRSRCRRCTCTWHQVARGRKLTPPSRPARPAGECSCRLARARHRGRNSWRCCPRNTCWAGTSRHATLGSLWREPLRACCKSPIAREIHRIGSRKPSK